MKNKNFNLLFDAKILANGANKTQDRSGIYFTAFNILKYMIKRDHLKITLYISHDKKDNLKKVLKQYFPKAALKTIVLKQLPEKVYVDNLSYICTQDKNFITRAFLNFIIYSHYYLQKLSLDLYCKLLSFNRFDAVFSPNTAFPECIGHINIKNRYTFLYDMILILFPHYYSIDCNHWALKLFKTLNGNDNYFTDSESARQDFLKYKPQIKPNKIHTVYLGCDFKYPDNPDLLTKVKTKYHIPNDKKYLFSLCSMEPRKNLIRMVKTFIEFVKKNNINDLVLVMGGGQWNSFKKKFDKETAGLSMDNVLQIGYVDDEDLPILYHGAEWFTYTSEYEGFGLPVLEAMKCGCPVITSDNSSLPEVIGDAGIKINCYSDEEHIAAYEKYYFNEALRKENAAKGLERAKLFNWDKTVDKMLKIMFEENNE